MTKRQQGVRAPRPAIRLGAVDVPVLVGRIRQLHEAGGDPELERFPDNDELLLLLRHAERAAGSLRPAEVMGEAALLRAQLWEHLREQADAGQLRAVEDARAVGVSWRRLAEVLCVKSKQGALQKARRLKAEQVRDPGERRSPETARNHEARQAAERRAESVRVTSQERRFPLAQRIARGLLAAREGLELDDLSEYWLEELEDTVDDRYTGLERANFSGYLESFVRAVNQYAAGEGMVPARTEEAARALASARAFTQQERPEGM